MLVQEKAERMHHNVTQQAITQMPHVTHPDPFHLIAIGQLTKDRVDKGTNAPQNGTVIGSDFARMRFTKGSSPKKPLVRKNACRSGSQSLRSPKTTLWCLPARWERFLHRQHSSVLANTRVSRPGQLSYVCARKP